MKTDLLNETIRVFDTWVDVPGKRLHFDVMTSDQATAIRLANEYLASQGYRVSTVTSRECRFCHAEPLAMFSSEQQKTYLQHGGFIVPLTS